MRTIGTIATHAFREILGTRIMYSIIAYAVLVMLFAVLASQWTIGEELRFITNMGLGSMLAIGLILVIVRGAATLSHEVERKTILLILARPIHRWQFIVGNFMGMAMVLLLLVAGMFIALVLILLPMGGNISAGLLAASWGIYLELLLVSGVALLASNLSSPVMATMLTLLAYLAGQMTSLLHQWISQSHDPLDSHLPASMQQMAQAYQSGPAHWFLKIAYYLLPNMSHVNFKVYATGIVPVSPDRVVLGTVYTVVYCALTIWIGIALFGRRDMR